MDFLKKHFDMKMYGVSVISILVALSILPCIMFLPIKYGYENGILENIQLLVLFIGMYLSFSAKTDKKFFIFVGLVLIILTLREVNCGRTLFFPIPGIENAYYGWKDIKYGYLAHPLFGIFIASVVVYFLKNKLYVNLTNYIKKTTLPIWNILFMVTGIVFGLYSEHSIHNMVFEEITELLFYVSLVGIIYLYSQHKNFILNQ